MTAVTRTPVATFSNPWAMTFLPNGRLLVTERGGTLRVVTLNGTGAATVSAPVSGVATVQAAGQGGLLDVALDPAFASNGRVYLSFAEAGTGGAGLAVARGTLTLSGAGGALSGVEVVWRQTPKIANDTRHYGGRMAFRSDGLLFVTAGDRHQGAPAQATGNTLGKIVAFLPGGALPAVADPRPEIWTLGHRNPYGLVFASDGRLFSSEMGPEGGDEFNLIVQGRNYGWRIVSEGNDGEVLPRHSTRPEFAAPLVSWTPVIAPGGMIQYRGTLFSDWTGDFVLAGLVQQGLVRVRVSGTTAAPTATEVGRVQLQARIREVEEGPDGALWVLEDGGSGRLIRLDPAFTL